LAFVGEFALILIAVCAQQTGAVTYFDTYFGAVNLVKMSWAEWSLRGPQNYTLNLLACRFKPIGGVVAGLCDRALGHAHDPFARLWVDDTPAITPAPL
jgi:hypothetical protein